MVWEEAYIGLTWGEVEGKSSFEIFFFWFPVAVHDIVFKSGSPSPRVLHLVASDACTVWKSLGRQLRIPDSTLDQIEADNIREGQYEQCYCMLTTWTEVQTDPPTYQELGQALQHETVGRPDIAKKYCCESDDEESVEMSTGKYKSHQPPIFFYLVRDTAPLVSVCIKMSAKYDFL